SPLSFSYQSSGTAAVTFSAKATDDSGNVSNPSTATISFSAPCTPGGNMERVGWKATASKSSSNATEGLDKALDGKADTRWTSGAGQAAGMWFQLDMGYPRSFDQVTFDATGSGSDFPQAYKLYVSNDPATPGTPIAEGAGQAITTIKLPAAKTGQFIRIECGAASGSFFSIHEVNVQCATASGIRFPQAGSNSRRWFSIDADGRHVLYQIPSRGKITIEEISLSGESQRVLLDGVQEAGMHRLALTGGPRGSKLAFLKISYDGKSHLQKVIFLK
ncbi:MAG: discoidin domain-containing protein, partial [Fibrobacteria bacterium]